MYNQWVIPSEKKKRNSKAPKGLGKTVPTENTNEVMLSGQTLNGICEKTGVQEFRKLTQAPRGCEMPKLQSTDTHWEHPISVVSMGIQAVTSDPEDPRMYQKCKTFRHNNSKLFIGVLMTSVLFSCLFSWTSLFFPIETTSDEESQPESPATKQAGQ